MTFHDLGTLGTANVIPKKNLTARINMLWENFSLRFAAELAGLSTGTIAVLQEALISKKDVKIKKEGDELDKFFAKVEIARNKRPYGFSGEVIESKADPIKEQEQNKVRDLARSILSIITTKSQDIHDIISKLGLDEVEDLQRVREELGKLGANKQLHVEIVNGRKLYTMPLFSAEPVKIDNVERLRGRKDAEDQMRVEKLKKLIQVSESLEIEQIGSYLGLNGQELFDRLVEWAVEFGFILDRQVVKFGTGKKNEFVAQLEKEFQAWGKDGKK